MASGRDGFKMGMASGWGWLQDGMASGWGWLLGGDDLLTLIMRVTDLFFRDQLTPRNSLQ